MGKLDETADAPTTAPPEEPVARRLAMSPHGPRRWLYAIPIAAALAGLAVVIATSGSRTRAPADHPEPAIDVEQQKFDAERRPDRILAALHIQPGWRVADVGADTGKLTVHLARAVGPTGKVVATDVDGGVLKLLDDRVARNQLTGRVEAREVGAEAPGLEPDKYDLVLVAHVDHYFGDPAGWFAAAKRALLPTGKLAVSNRLDRKDRAMAAAEKAGFVVESQSAVTPTDYLVVFVPAKRDALDDVPIIPPIDAKRMPAGLHCAPGTPALTPTAVDDALADIKVRGGFDEAGLDRAIGKQGLTRLQYKAQLERQLMALGCHCPTGYAPKRDAQNAATCARAGFRYECEPGTPEVGVGCSCPAGSVSRLDADNVYHCVK